MEFNIQIKKLANRLYFANCPKLPSCFVQANSEKQAISRINDAIKLTIMSYKKHFEKVPFENQ